MSKKIFLVFIITIIFMTNYVLADNIENKMDIKQNNENAAITNSETEKESKEDLESNKLNQNGVIDNETDENKTTQNKVVEEKLETEEAIELNEIKDKEEINDIIDTNITKIDKEQDNIIKDEETDQVLKENVVEQEKKQVITMMQRKEPVRDLQIENSIGEKTISDGVYSIATKLNTKFGLDVTARQEQDGVNIELWELAEKNHQRFYIQYLGDGTYSIEALHSEKYLTVEGAKVQSGTNVEQSTFKDMDSQKWIIKSTEDGYFNIISKCNNLNLNVDGLAINGTNINVKTANNSSEQKFKFNKIVLSSGTKTIEDGIYTIKSKMNTNYALDINYASLENNANLELYQYKNSGNNQNFKITYLSNGYYSIEAMCSSKLLTVYQSLTADRTNVSQYTKNNTYSQEWIIKLADDGSYNIISKCNNLYLNVDGKAKNCTNINVRVKNDEDSQKFIFTKVQDADIQATKSIDNGKYTICSCLNNNYVLDITATSLLQGANVELFSSNDRNNQKFQITYIGNGEYKIETLHSNKALTVTRSLTTEGANVEQRDYVGANSQKWAIKSAGNNYYYLISKCNGLALSIENNNAINGANIVTKTLKNNDSQKFKFRETDYYRYVTENKYYIKSEINSEMVLDVTARSTANGTNIELWINKYMAHQKFQFEYLGSGEYVIKAVHSDKVLTVQISNKNVEQREYQQKNTQKWEIVKAGGFYFIRSKYNGLYLSIDGLKANMGDNISVSDIENCIDNKKFIIENNMCNGIDISQYNGTINWRQVCQAGVDFAILRVGFRGYGSGKIVSDTKYTENAKGATSNGIAIGAYFVTQATNYEEGQEEASRVLEIIKESNTKITYPIVVDIEWAGGSEGNNGRADYIGVIRRTEAAKGFCETIKRAGYTPMIYANKYWLTSFLDTSKLNEYDVWLAHYVSGAPNKTSDYNGKYMIWQYTSKGTVLGINGNVDIDISYKLYN